jgi:formate hydrogenlyase subunit 4
MYDFVAGHAGIGILAAVTIETMLALTFALSGMSIGSPSSISCVISIRSPRTKPPS